MTKMRQERHNYTISTLEPDNDFRNEICRLNWKEGRKGIAVLRVGRKEGMDLQFLFA